MEKIYISKDGKKIDLSKLSLQELQQLNITEEEYFAQEIKKKRKFSNERNIYMKEAYEKVFQIADWKRLYNQDEDRNKGNGVKGTTLDLVKRIIKKKKRKNQRKKESIVFYEAGVGHGYAINNIKEEGVIIKGCDIFLSEEVKNIVKQRKHISMEENNLYDALDTIQDEEIDVFYADNMLEHIVPDEYEETCEKIVRKIKPNGIAIFVIPNSYTGPHDVSKFKPNYEGKATGFHFMEQTYQENMKVFRKHQLKLKCFCWRDWRKELHVRYSLNILNVLKIKMEKYLGKIKNKSIRYKIFGALGYDMYILEKRRGKRK